jgi:hypothetical protein
MYIILLCGNALMLQTYTPDLMYALVGPAGWTGSY